MGLFARLFGSEREAPEIITAYLTSGKNSDPVKVHEAGAWVWSPDFRDLDAFRASTAALVADVQGWIAAPSSNAGWLLRVDETAPAPNAKRFNSRQNATAASVPQLTVTYVAGGVGPPPEPGPAGIPALGPAGLALLALSMALAGLAATRWFRRGASRRLR